MTIRAVIFDLDGTLLDTIQDIADAVNKTLASLGFPEHEVKAYKYFVGDGEDKLAFRALPEGRRDQATVSAVLAGFRKICARHWGDKTSRFPGIPELLDSVTRMGLKMAVLSNKSQPFTKDTVTAFLAAWRFEVVLGAQPSVPAKPDPAGALNIASLIGLAPTDFLYLGDSGVDMKTAVAAGMYPVGALWGYRTADELLTAGAKALIEAPAGLLGLLHG